MIFIAVAAAGQQDPAYEPLSKAFDALRAHNFDAAIARFGEAAVLSSERTDIRKNLAYTLLKTGENEAAREQFGIVMRLDPRDDHAALEYAFLCFEAREDASARKAEARRIFDRLRAGAGSAELRGTAAAAFANIDEPLRSGIARWREVLATSTPTFSAWYDLAQLTEQRDERDLAASAYRAAFQLQPERKSVLLDLARVEKARGDGGAAMAALLAASRGGEPRAAELAREQLPERYPYVYEFRAALALDPGNGVLHRELAYLLLSMSEGARSEEAKETGSASLENAEREFRSVLQTSPEDYLAAAQLGLLYLGEHRESDALPLLKGVLAHGDPVTANRVRMGLHLPLVLEQRTVPESALDPRILGERSYNAGFLKDALRYFLQAREANPLDATVALKLGWANNMLHDDASAVRWFDVARRSADASVAVEAQKAYSNLLPGSRHFRTTLWVYPLYSSRWSDVFGYGQVKTELRINKLPVHSYLSLRFVGDVRRQTAEVVPQALSESAFILGAGVATNSWHGGLAWGEVGEALGFLDRRHWRDYRGGVSYSKTTGASLTAEHGGPFLENNADSVFVSHFNNDLITYSQNKLGYTAVAGSLNVQTFWSANATFDSKRQYWANFVETGPGLRWHPPGWPQSVTLTVSAVRGVYLVNEGNPRRPNFNDFRVGFWYAFTR